MTGRRPMVEAAFARTAAATPEPHRAPRRRGEGAAHRRAETTAGVPHVVGWPDRRRRGAAGRPRGRRHRPAVAAAVAARGHRGATAPVEELEDSGFMYYGRYYRSPDGALPFAFGPPLQHYDSVSVLTLAADNGTWGMGLVTAASDAELRPARDVATWERIVVELPAGRALARGRAPHRHPAHGQDRGPPPQLRGRRPAGGHRGGARRRLVGLHQPVGRAGGQHRADPRGGAARPRPRPRARRPGVVRHRPGTTPPSRRSSRSTATPSTSTATGWARSRPRSRACPTRPTIRRGPSARPWRPRPVRTPTSSGASSTSPACWPAPTRCCSDPGLLDRVLASAETPAEPLPGPSRAELVDIVQSA